MKIRYQEKPTPELLKKYIKKLEYYLSAHGVKIEIKLYYYPLDIYSFMDGREIGRSRHWIECIVVSTKEISRLEISMFAEGIDEDWEREVWLEAHHVQDEMYKYLKRSPTLPPNNEDPYWKLWDRRKE